MWYNHKKTRRGEVYYDYFNDTFLIIEKGGHFPKFSNGEKLRYTELTPPQFYLFYTFIGEL